jgi:hypothetical protein
LKLAERHNVPATRIGNVGEVNGRFVLEGAGTKIDVSIEDLSDIWRAAIPRLMGEAD